MELGQLLMADCKNTGDIQNKLKSKATEKIV